MSIINSNLNKEMTNDNIQIKIELFNISLKNKLKLQKNEDSFNYHNIDNIFNELNLYEKDNFNEFIFLFCEHNFDLTTSLIKDYQSDFIINLIHKINKDKNKSIINFIKNNHNDYIKLLNFFVDELYDYNQNTHIDKYSFSIIKNYFFILNKLTDFNFIYKNYSLKKNDEFNLTILEKIPNVLKSVKERNKTVFNDSFEGIEIDYMICELTKNIFDIAIKNNKSIKNNDFLKYPLDDEYTVNLSIKLHEKFLYLNCPDLIIDNEKKVIIYKENEIKDFLNIYSDFYTSNKFFRDEGGFFINEIYGNFLPLFCLVDNKENPLMKEEVYKHIVYMTVTKRFFNNENITDLFLDNCSELILTDGDTYYYVENNYYHKKICEEIINKFKKDESHDLYYSVNNTNINRSNFEMNELKRVGLGCRIGTFFNNGYIKKYNKLIKLSHNPDNLYTIKNNSYLYENETDETRKNFNLELMFLKEIVTIKLKKIVTIKLKKHDSNQNERDFDDLMFDILEQTAFGDKKNINCFNTIFKMIEDFVINYSSDGSNSKSYFNAIHINKIDINFFSKLYSDILFINLIDCAKNKADVLNSIKQERENNNYSPLISYQDKCDYEFERLAHIINDSNIHIYKMVTNKHMFLKFDDADNVSMKSIYDICLKSDFFERGLKFYYADKNITDTSIFDLDVIQKLFLYNKLTILNNKYPLTDYIKNKSKNEKIDDLLECNLHLFFIKDEIVKNLKNFNEITKNHDDKENVLFLNLYTDYHYILISNLLNSYNEFNNNNLKNNIKEYIIDYTKYNVDVFKFKGYLNDVLNLQLVTENNSENTNELYDDIQKIKNTIDDVLNLNTKNNKTKRISI